MRTSHRPRFLPGALLHLGLHVLAGLLLCAVVFPLLTDDRQQAVIRRWSAGLLRIFRVRLDVLESGGTRDPPGPGRYALPPSCMVVANHISWLDIFVINAMQPCHFVAKSEIRDWPLLGYLSSRAGTIFLARGSARDVRATFKRLVARLGAGEQVAFFPEGTTAAQGTLLPFHANLFQAAIEAGVPLQPLALRYLDVNGQLCSAVDFTGDTTFSQSLLNILRGPALLAQILVLPGVPVSGAARRDLALVARGSIETALSHQGAGSSGV